MNKYINNCIYVYIYLCSQRYVYVYTYTCLYIHLVWATTATRHDRSDHNHTTQNNTIIKHVITKASRYPGRVTG